MTKKVKVLIIDDSVAICQFLTKALSTDKEMLVVGHALNPLEAREMIKKLSPDVLTLDVEMPKMDGLTFLKNLMRLRPMPVVMISALTAAGAKTTLDALEAGAVDFMVKRHPGSKEELKAYIRDIVRVVKDASRVKTFTSDTAGNSNIRLPDLSVCQNRLDAGRQLDTQLQRIISIGASTGGPEALRLLLTSLQPNSCALMISQHMPSRFMQSFAERLDSVSAFKIAIANDGQKVTPGHGYVAPGDRHLELVKSSDGLTCKVSDSEPVCGHRPSVEVMFNSVARTAPRSAIGILMTGMGDDGAQAMLKMHDAGSLTLIQDKKSSAVWGMPGRAMELNAVDETLSLNQMAPAINQLLMSTGR